MREVLSHINASVAGTMRTLFLDANAVDFIICLNNKIMCFFLLLRFALGIYLALISSKKQKNLEALDDNRTKLDFTYKNCSRIDYLHNYQPDLRDSTSDSNNVIPCE